MLTGHRRKAGHNRARSAAFIGVRPRWRHPGPVEPSVAGCVPASNGRMAGLLPATAIPSECRARRSMRVLIVYGSTEGHTRELCHFAARTLGEAGFPTAVTPARSQGSQPDLTRYDATIL